MNIPRRMLAVVGGALLVAACGSAAPSPAGAAASAGTNPATSVAPPTASYAVAASSAPMPDVAVVCDKTTKAFDAAKIDLSGPWAGDDGGIYYLRQKGSVLWWNGMSGRSGTLERLGRDWNNVGRGEIKGVSIDVEWADMPRGQILDGGTMNLKIEDDGSGNVQIVKVSQASGDFGNTTWTPCKPG
jgi:hypothetical protein